MKKVILMLTLLASVMVGAKAQIATENSNALDNISAGVTAGVSTPLDFNNVFPLNTNVGLKFQKDFTPVVGIQLEGLAVLNDNHFSDIKTAVKATNVGLNGAINLNNLFGEYLGTPRTFEVSAIVGMGWLHSWDTSVNNLTSKTGLDFALNLGKKKAHSFVLTPAVYWNLTGNFPHHKVQFNKNYAQLAVNLSYVYHFKTSNGTHHFKTWDVGAMINEISRLNGALDECEKREPKVIERVVEVIKPAEQVVVTNPFVIQFAQKSAELTDEAKAILDTINRDLIVDVVGTASPEGDAIFNQRISEKRAAVVADYLTKRGLRINSWTGKGVQIGKATNRLAIVTVAQ